MTYQKVTGTLSPGAHPGGANGQDAYSDLLIVEEIMEDKNEEVKVFDARGNGTGETAPTITGDHQNRITDYTAVCVGNGQLDQLKMSEKVGALNCMHDQQAVMCIGNGQVNQLYMQDKVGALNCLQDPQKVMVAAVDCRNSKEDPNINGTLQAKSTGGTGTNFNNVCRQGAIVRRLTPLECERLQGYPDGWTDIGEWVDSKGKLHKPADSPRYKALGNSIALPFWQFLARRMCAQYERDITMGSLFDGISGFPLVFARCGAKPLWTSEIEEFPIAVCKKHFGNEETGEKGDFWEFFE